VNSRFGVRGSEDLGDGLHAIFTLESGIAMTNGSLQQGGRLFGRQAFVGLESNRYGTLMLGRQITPMYRYFLPLDPLNYSSYGLSAQDGQFAGRADNAAAYLGRYGSFETNLLYSFGYDSTVVNGAQVPGEFRVGKQYDIGVRYLQGPANVTFVYEQRQGQSTATADDDERRFLAGGSYAIGSATLYAGYELLLNNVPATLNASPSRYMAFGGVRYQLTSLVSVAAAGYYHSYRNVSAHALSSGVNADYALSKRTTLYVDVTYVANSGNAAQSATGATTPVVRGRNQLAAALGIVHRF
jgi:predicted porin